MSVYRPERKGTSSKFYVCEFVYQGKRFQESTGSTSKTVAREYEKQRRAELERAAAGLPTVQKSKRILTVADVTKPYLEGYAVNHRASSLTFSKERLAKVVKYLGKVVLSDLTEDRIREYMSERQADGVSGRTINMELGELSRAMGHTWKVLWPKVKKLEERKDVGRALSPEEQRRLLDALAECQTPHLPTLIPLLLLTGMRAGEALSLTWGQVDMLTGEIKVGLAKTSSGTGRGIPINADLLPVLARHRERFVELFAEPEPENYLFAWGSPSPSDPTRHVTDPKHGWNKLRERAKVSCRLHDLRHTFATQLAENGVPESTMLSLMGHISRHMLELYSHIRMKAKRDAMAGVRLHPAGQISEVVPVKVPVATLPQLVQ